MSYRELALSMDAQEYPLEAAWAYEIAVQAPQAELDLFLNLAVLYFVCEDTGYNSYHRLNIDYVSAAYDRIPDILAAAENRFGKQTEIDFWRLYIPEWGPPYQVPQVEQYEKLAHQGGSLMPYFRLYIDSNGTRYREKAKALLTQVQDGSTERKRYIKSVLESSALPGLV